MLRRANRSMGHRPVTTKPVPDASVRVRHAPGGTVGEMDQDTNLIDSALIDSALIDSAGTDGPDAEIVDELLIEEISIDGMCGVY